MKKTTLFIFVVALLFSSCSDTEKGYRFYCKIDGAPFDSDDIPEASVTTTTITVIAYSESSRFQLTTPYSQQDLYQTGDAGEGLVQYWPDGNNISEVYTSEGADTSGYIFIERITGSGVTGSFKATLRKDGSPDIALEGGDFYARRP